jgi:predicted dinucleotide-binding enzyme
MPKTINIIGAGRLGKTIARLITTAKAGEIQCILNKSLESGLKAVNLLVPVKFAQQSKDLKQRIYISLLHQMTT